jgi:uncharacterized membrane protein YgaE (UPF0421/DUF939 family)
MPSLSLTSGLPLAIRAALAAGLAVAIADLCKLQYPVYAMIGAVIVTDLGTAPTRQLGLQRLVGTGLGAAVGAVLSSFMSHGPLAIGLGIFAAMLLSHVLFLQAAAKVAGYVAGIVLLNYSAEPWAYAFARLIETALGIGAAMLVSLLPRVIGARSSGAGSGE